MADLKVAVEIGARDRFSGPAAKVRGAAGKLQKQFSDAQAELKDLGKQRVALDSLARLERGLGKSGTAFDAARKRTAALRAEMRATASPSKKLADAFERSREKSSRLGSAHDRQRSKLRQLRDELRESGLATNRLSDAQAELDRRMRRSAAGVDRARAASDELAARRMASDRSRERFAQTALALQGAGAAGRSALRALAAPVRMARGVAAARGDLQSLGLDPAAAEAIATRGREVSLRIPGIGAEGFTLAAYDIQSGIQGLSTEGVSALTEASAVTARATKGEVADMTGLMASLHSVFKDALHAGMSDAEFGWAAAGQLSAAVEQFKTTGPKMQQAIESAGSQMALSGVSMAQQFSAVGLLQAKMDPSRAGTALRAFAKTASKAEGELAKGGRSVRLLDDAGNLLPLTEAMESLRQAFGSEFTTREQAEVAEAFGSEEAAEAIAALWGAAADQAAAVSALEAAGLSGEAFVRAMQARRDDNEDSRLDLLRARWNNLVLTVGKDLVGALDRLAPALTKIIDGAQWAADEFPNLTAGAVIAGGAFAAVTAAAGIAAPSLIALAFAARQFGDWRAGRRIAGQALGPGRAPKPGRGFFGRAADAGRRIAPRVPALGKLAPLAKGAAGIAGRTVPFGATALAALDLGSAALSSPPDQRSGAVADAAGGFAGSLAGATGGAKLGALIGTAVFPGAGTAIGAALGGVAGGIAGGELGSALTSWLRGESSPEQDSAPAPDPASFVGPLPAPAADVRKTVNVNARIDIHPRPGEDDEALARRVLDELRRMQDLAGREALGDAY